MGDLKDSIRDIINKNVENMVTQVVRRVETSSDDLENIYLPIAININLSYDTNVDNETESFILASPKEKIQDNYLKVGVKLEVGFKKFDPPRELEELKNIIKDALNNENDESKQN